MKYYDQHTHSSFSTDSDEDLRNYFVVALKENINYICTCEHFDYLTVVDGTTWEADYDKLMEYHKKLQLEFPTIKPLLGIELGYKKSSLEAIKELAEKYPFDIIQLSVHDNDKWDYYFENAFDIGIDESMNEYFNQMIEGINSFSNYDVLSHIDFAFKTAKMMNHFLEFNRYEKQIVEVMKLIIKNKKAFEINTKVQEVIYNIDLNDHHCIYLLSLYKSLGGQIVSLSSDAHSVDKYRCGFDKYLKIIKQCGFKYVVYYINRKEYKYVI